MYSQKKNQKEAFWYFRKIQHFFFHYYVVPRPKKMNVLVLRHSNIMSNVATLINLIVILKRG